MAEFVWFVLLNDVKPLGMMEFTKVEWWVKDSFCVCVRYSIDGVEKPLGIRLDLDKRAFLDDLDDAGSNITEEEIEDRKMHIWDLVIDARENNSAWYYKPSPNP